MKREDKYQAKRMDLMGHLNNVLTENINRSQLPLAEILMILKKLEKQVIEGFIEETKCQ
jgi:hypothetical protein